MSDDEKSTPDTFTRADVRRMIGAEVAKVREQFADYDDLKARAGEADKSKSAIERIEAKLDEATKRADKAERETLIRDVAEHFGISVRLARKFEGATKDEMISDGTETLADMGIEPDKSKRASANGNSRANGTKATEQDDDRTDEQDDDNAPEAEPQQRDDAPPARTPRAARRPTESLRSGAPSGRSNGSGTDNLTPAELAAKIRI